MEFKDAVKEIGKEPAVENNITWDDCKDELEKVINMRNDEYAEHFRKARAQEAQVLTKKYIAENPKRDDETDEDYKKRVIEYATDYINQSPDEFTRNLRTYCNLGTAIFNQLVRLNGEIIDFKEVYMALHEDDIKAYAERHKDEILAQQKALAQAKINQERHDRAVANKQKLNKKIGKK